MVCRRCQKEIAAESRYCYYCGEPQFVARAEHRAPHTDRRLMRSWSDKKIAGVCAGFAKYFDTDVTLVRLLWVVLTVVPGAFIGGALVYLLAWIIMPMEPEPVATQTSPAQTVPTN